MKFSVTVPAFKRQYLKECIDSILAQTYGDFELIIVNDASPEDLGSIVSQYDDPRIRYYVNDHNCGAVNVVDNWNIALSYATGDYVICMGDDDRLLPNCLEEYARMIEAYPGLGVYHAWTQIIDEHSAVIDMQEPRPLRESVYSMIWCRWHGRMQFIGDFLFDTALLKRNGGFYKMPLAWGSDDISTFIAAKDTGIANSQVPMFQYRRSTITISRTGNIDIKMEAANQEEQWYTAFLAAEPDDANEIAKVYWHNCKTRLSLHMSKKRIYQMARPLGEAFLKYLITFYRNRKKYHITSRHITYACIEMLKERFKK